MASSSNNGDKNLENMFEDYFEQQIEEMYNNIVDYQPTVPTRRAYIERNREDGHNRLWNDYFSADPTYPPDYFRRRFRMNRSLFTGIVNRFSNEVPYFQHRRDAVGRFGLTPLQKCTAAIRMLAYGCAGDMVDEYLRMGESTALLCLENFSKGVIDLYGEEYLRKPTPEDLQRLLDIGEVRGFPGMIGSIDCMHWEWKNCPHSWKGQYTRGAGKPTIVLEAVASQDLWIWHAFFGPPGTLNDINVLERSPVFDDIIYGRAPKLEFTVNGHKYHRAYYLTDGIYPKWPTFIQSISLPQGPEARLFAERQEAARKDVERAFGVLQARFAIVRNPALLWDKEKISNIIRACIILHNMIVEDERDGYSYQYDTTMFVEGETSRSSEVDFSFSTNMPTNLATKRKSESESSWQKNTTLTDKKKISVSLLEENLRDSSEVNNTIQYEAANNHDEVDESSSMMDEINREIEAHLSGLNKQAGFVGVTEVGESKDAANIDGERRQQLEEIERQIKAAAATRIVAEGITKRKSKDGTHEIKSEAKNGSETSKAQEAESNYIAASTESRQHCSTCGGLRKGKGDTWMLGSLGIAQSGVWRCFDQDKNGLKVEEDASIVIPKYDIDTIIKEESISQDSESKTSSLIASLTQIVEKYWKDLWSSSVNIGKSSKESSEKLKATLKQYRGISARELVTRSDFEEILETAALYEELSSASVSYISKMSMYRSVIREGVKSSQRVQLAQARAKLLKDMAHEKQKNVDEQFALVKALAQRGDMLYVKIFAIKKLVSKLEAEKEEVDMNFTETVRNLSRVIEEASEAYEEYHVVVRKWKEEQVAAEFSREAIESAEVVWVQFLSTL